MDEKENNFGEREKKNRRTSILKDAGFTSNKVADNEDVPLKNSKRRVSFANTNTIQEFLISRGVTDDYKCSYEQDMYHSSFSDVSDSTRFCRTLTSEITINKPVVDENLHTSAENVILKPDTSELEEIDQEEAKKISALFSSMFSMDDREDMEEIEETKPISNLQMEQNNPLSISVGPSGVKATNNTIEMECRPFSMGQGKNYVSSEKVGEYINMTISGMDEIVEETTPAFWLNKDSIEKCAQFHETKIFDNAQEMEETAPVCYMMKKMENFFPSSGVEISDRAQNSNLVEMEETKPISHYITEVGNSSQSHGNVSAMDMDMTLSSKVQSRSSMNYEKFDNASMELTMSKIGGINEDPEIVVEKECPLIVPRPSIVDEIFNDKLSNKTLALSQNDAQNISSYKGKNESEYDEKADKTLTSVDRQVSSKEFQELDKNELKKESVLKYKSIEENLSLSPDPADSEDSVFGRTIAEDTSDTNESIRNLSPNVKSIQHLLTAPILGKSIVFSKPMEDNSNYDSGSPPKVDADNNLKRKWVDEDQRSNTSDIPQIEAMNSECNNTINKALRNSPEHCSVKQVRSPTYNDQEINLFNDVSIELVDESLTESEEMCVKEQDCVNHNQVFGNTLQSSLAFENAKQFEIVKPVRKCDANSELNAPGNGIADHSSCSFEPNNKMVNSDVHSSTPVSYKSNVDSLENIIAKCRECLPVTLNSCNVPPEATNVVSEDKESNLSASSYRNKEEFIEIDNRNANEINMSRLKSDSLHKKSPQKTASVDACSELSFNLSQSSCITVETSPVVSPCHENVFNTSPFVKHGYCPDCFTFSERGEFAVLQDMFEILECDAGSCKLKLKDKPFTLSLDLSVYEKHLMVVIAKWSPQLDNLKKPSARLVIQSYGPLISKSVEDLSGLMICDLIRSLESVLLAYNSAMHFLWDLFLINTFFLTEEIHDHGLSLKLFNARARLCVSVRVEIKPKREGNFEPSMQVSSDILLGNMRKNTLEEAVAEFGASPKRLLALIKNLDFIIQNMVK